MAVDVDETPSSPHYQLMVVVPSIARMSHERRVVRDTWAHATNLRISASCGAHVRFVVGTKGIHTEEMHQLQREHDQYHDLIFVDVREHYGGLARKTLAWLQWAAQALITHEPSFDFILKTDHDAFIRMRPLLTECCHLIYNATGASGVDPYHLRALSARYGHRFTIDQSLEYARTHNPQIARNALAMDERTPTSMVYWGHMHISADVATQPEHRNFDVFAAKQFPPFASGSGYILSADLVLALGNRDLPLKLYNNEDTSVGLWINALDAQYRHDVRFNEPDCTRDMIIYHRAHYVMFSSLLADDRDGDICRHVPVTPTWQQRVTARVWRMNYAPWIATALMVVTIKSLQWYHQYRYRRAHNHHQSH